MKKILSLIFLLRFCFPAGAQVETGTDTKESNEIRTVFGQPHHIGWWISSDLGWTKLGSRNVFPGGISGGIIINHSFSIGLAGYGIMNSHNLRYSGINDTADVYLYGGYGGLKLEYRINPLKKVNIAFPFLIGGGALTYSTWEMGNMHNRNYTNSEFSYAYDAFFVIEPGVSIGFNVLRFLRLDAGISYRFTSKIDLPQTAGNLMNGFNAGISLKVGRF